MEKQEPMKPAAPVTDIYFDSQAEKCFPAGGGVSVDRFITLLAKLIK